MLKFKLLVCVLIVAYATDSNLGASASDFNSFFSGINKNAIVDWRGNNYNSNSIGDFTSCLSSWFSSSFSTWIYILGKIDRSNVFSIFTGDSNSIPSFWESFLDAIYQCENISYDTQTKYLKSCGAATFRYVKMIEKNGNFVILDGCDVTYNLDNFINNFNSGIYERAGFYLVAIYKQLWRHYYDNYWFYPY